MIAVPIALRYQGAGCLAMSPSTGAIVCVACGTPVTGDGTTCCVAASPHFITGEHAQLLNLAALPEIVTGLLALVHVEARAIALALDAHGEAGYALDEVVAVVLAAGHSAIDGRLADALGRRAALSVKSRSEIVALARVASPAVALLLERPTESERAWAWVRDGRVELVAQLYPLADTSTPTIASSRLTSVAGAPSSRDVADAINAREAFNESAALLACDAGFSRAEAESRARRAIETPRPADRSASPTTPTDNTAALVHARYAR